MTGKASEFVNENFIAPSGPPEGDPLATKKTKQQVIKEPLLSAEDRRSIKHKYLNCYAAKYNGQVPPVHGHPHAYEQKHISNLAWNIAYAINPDDPRMVDREEVFTRCIRFIDWIFTNIDKIERAQEPGWRFTWTKLGSGKFYQMVRGWFVNGIPTRPVDRVSETQQRGGWKDDD